MYAVSYIKRSDMQAAADQLGVGVDVIMAVTQVEARKSGFIKGTDLPCILFEGHHFHKNTKGRFDRSHPHLSYPSWTKEHYVGGRGEYDRLVEAIDINDDVPDPALLATSWGMFQVMGFNFSAAGYDSVKDFTNDMALGEDRHLAAFVSFIAAEGMADMLRSADWANFARRYNGPAYAKNAYDTKLAVEFSRARVKLQEEQATGKLSPERGDIVAVQSALNVEIDAGLIVDGWMGKRTREAIQTFQRQAGIEPDGNIDAALLNALGLAETVQA